MRTYEYGSERRTGPTTISYVRCAHCHRHAGATSPGQAGLADDPLSAEEHATLDSDLDALLQRLDQLWDTGRLP